MTASPAPYLTALFGITRRELLRFMQQRERFVASLARPILWFLVFSAGLRASLQLEPGAVYHELLLTGVSFSYELYLLPGLLAMILLFSSMQSALSMVFDREMGSMRILLVSPLPRGYLLFCKLFAGSVIGLMQAAIFLAFASLYPVGLRIDALLLAMPLLLLGGVCCGALGLWLSSMIRQLENFAGVMNFVIFPLFFLSSALYPLTNFEQSNVVFYYLALCNPFTHVVELLRFGLLGELKFSALMYVGGCTALFSILASRGYNPARGMMKRKFA